MPRLYQYHERTTHFELLPPVNAQFSLLRHSHERVTHSMLSSVNTKHVASKPGHLPEYAPAICRIEATNQAPANTANRKKTLKKSRVRVRVCSDEEAQEKRDMKKIVRQLEADDKKEKLQRMQVSITPDTKQDLETYVPPKGGVANQSLACKVNVGTAGKKSRTKVLINKTLREDEAQEKKDMKKLVMQLEADAKTETLKKMPGSITPETLQDVETHISSIGGVVNQAPACKVMREKKNVGKKSRRALVHKTVRDEEAQEKRDMKKIVKQLEADDKREKLKKIQVLLTSDAEQELEAYALRLQKKLLVALKKKCKSNIPQQKISKQMSKQISLEQIRCKKPPHKDSMSLSAKKMQQYSAKTVCIKKRRQIAFVHEVKKNTEPKPTMSISAKEPQRIGKKLQATGAHETVKTSCKSSSFNHRLPKAAKKSFCIRQVRQTCLLPVLIPCDQ